MFARAMDLLLFVAFSCLVFESSATILIKNKTETVERDYKWLKNVSIFPILPMAAPYSTNEICKIESEYFIKNLVNLTTWAYQMWDASAKGVVGQAVGSIHNFGDFDECLGIKGPVKTQFCLAEIEINMTPTKKINKYIDKYEPYEHLANRLYYTNVKEKMRRDKTFWGLCIPNSCSNKEMEITINNYLNQQSQNSLLNISYSVNIASELCQTAERKSDKYSTADIIFCTILAVLTLLVILGTLLDEETYEITKTTQKSALTHVLNAFSLRKNFKHLGKFDESFPRLNALFGVRFFGIIFVVIGHRTGTSVVGGPLHNRQYMFDIYESWSYSPIIHADIIVDSFFLISGILLTVMLLKQFEKKIVNPFLVILLRYIRLTPLYALVIFYYATIFDKIGSGPFWKLVNEPEAQMCRENWWTNLLYINNYVNTDRLCMVQAWYLPCDFHYFIVGLFSLLLLKKNRRLGLTLVGVLLVVSLIVPFLIVYLGRKPALTMFYEDFIVDTRGHDSFQTMYTKSHTRASPYFVGIFVGYIFYKMKDSTLKLTQVTSCLLAILGLAIMLISVSTAITFYAPGKPYNALESAAYASLNRFSWAVGSAFVILAIGFGEVPFLGKLLCWKPWIPLSKLVYGVYILHMQLMFESIGARRHLTHVSNYIVLRQIIADVVLSFGLALLAYLWIENPFRNILTFIFSNKIKQTVAPAETNETQITRIKQIIKPDEV